MRIITPHSLAIGGTLAAAAILAIFLFAISGGAAYAALPPGFAERGVNGAGQGGDLQAQADQTKNETISESISQDAICSVSERFPPEILQWCDMITRFARQHDLSPDLVAAMIWQESGGDALAYSSSGAVGLMQVMPSDGIAGSFMCANGPCFSSRPSTAELQDPEFNLAFGTQMLARLVKRNGSLREALKAYGPMDSGYSYADKVMRIFFQYGQN